jgi:hypothetical protein
MPGAGITVLKTNWCLSARSNRLEVEAVDAQSGRPHVGCIDLDPAFPGRATRILSYMDKTEVVTFDVIVLDERTLLMTPVTAPGAGYEPHLLLKQDT